jgi:hypothetical protein
MGQRGTAIRGATVAIVEGQPDPEVLERRRPPDPQRTAGQARRVRLQSTKSSTTPTGSSSTTPSRSGTRQTPRSWPRRSNGSPAAPDIRPARSPPTPATARHLSNATYSSAWQAWRSRARAHQAPPAASSNIGEPSATRSNGGPDPKEGSTTSNEATAGIAPNSPASTAPEPGADTASSPTTSSRSAPSQHETNTTAAESHPTATPTPQQDTAAHRHHVDEGFFRSK